ncbi:MAG: metallopeptidase TldD-related protein, partial [Gemmatimonadota bacterium]
LPSTGHARRLAFAPPRVGYTNLVLASGDTPASDLLGGDEVVLVEDLHAAPGNVMDGRVAFTTPWAYRVVRGEVVGRFPRITLRGNAYQMLDRLAAVGCEAVWLGAWCGPAMLLDGISIVHH